MVFLTEESTPEGPGLSTLWELSPQVPCAIRHIHDPGCCHLWANLYWLCYAGGVREGEMGLLASAHTLCFSVMSSVLFMGSMVLDMEPEC